MSAGKIPEPFISSQTVMREFTLRAKVIEAEAQIPTAMSEAFKTGNLGIMDYYKMKNIQADTSMRDSIAGPQDTKKD